MPDLPPWQTLHYVTVSAQLSGEALEAFFGICGMQYCWRFPSVKLLKPSFCIVYLQLLHFHYFNPSRWSFSQSLNVTFGILCLTPGYLTGLVSLRQLTCNKLRSPQQTCGTLRVVTSRAVRSEGSPEGWLLQKLSEFYFGTCAAVVEVLDSLMRLHRDLTSAVQYM